MKKSWLHILLILITNCAAAQTYPLREKLDLVFSHVDKSQVPTGFLVEYGPRLVPLSVLFCHVGKCITRHKATHADTQDND